MNERIRLLSEQAHRSTADELAHLQRVHNRTYDLNESAAIYNEKFAELIVQECIAQCEQVATAADAKSKSKFVTDDGRMLHEGMWGGAKNCSGQIKQHFGVRE
jgi:hypothetical protein